ncbi:MBL fold metallo-hydrolase [bacterium]|nr:MAG: MBL fold metallo-hydrolase [bacterium]
MMKLRFLGTGTSYGVPYIGCPCEVCHSSDPRDKRLRASILIEDVTEDGHLVRLLVDTGPDFRTQMLRADVDYLSAVLWTHLHNDHIIGLDDIRPLTDRQGYIDGYGDAPTLGRLHSVFDYVFVQERDHGGFPRVTPHIVEPGQKLVLGGITVTPLQIVHGQRPILAYQFEKNGQRIVYATDCSHIPEESYEAMKGCDIFIVDALRHAAHPTHFSLSQALEAAEIIGPGRALFTHITHDLGHAETEATLPPHVRIAYDGLEISL